MTESKQLIIISDPQYLRHDTGGGEHPEVPERLTVISNTLKSGHLGRELTIIPPRPAKRSEILAFHQESWLFRFEEAVLTGSSQIGHPDNQICYESYDTAVLSAGAALTAIDQLEKQSGQTVFCLNRPPGHHAEPAQAHGFCFFNNSVIAARYWQEHHGRQRIAIIDFDAHHGNGIQTAFENEPDSLYISIHEDPSCSYPGTGWASEQGFGPGKGTIFNIPLSTGAGDSELIEAMDNQAYPALKHFSPDAIIIAAGFDGHKQDDMSGLNYSTNLFGQIGHRLASWANQLCNSRLISVLEGGYHLPTLGQSVEAYLAALAEK